MKARKKKNIRISMTQTGDPLHNALAERVNNTVKNDWLFNNGELLFNDAHNSIDNAIMMFGATTHNSKLIRLWKIGSWLTNT